MQFSREDLMTELTPTADFDAMRDIAEARGLHLVRVTHVHHWTAGLFSFQVERPATFRFRSGEFIMIGLLGEGGKPLLRAYSIASPSWDEHLEFFSVKVADGALTSRLQHLQVGDHIFLGKKPTGTLVIDALLPGETLCMVGTGTGLAPFLSVLRDPETHEKFDRIIITHTVRQVEELAYRSLLEEDIRNDEIFGEALKDRFIYYPTVTREDFRKRGRITDLIRSGEFRSDIGVDDADRGSFRFMLCGSMAFNKDMAALLESQGLVEGTHAAPGTYVMERAFVG
jgi:ferredoxin--NADP+ reductase